MKNLAEAGPGIDLSSVETESDIKLEEAGPGIDLSSVETETGIKSVEAGPGIDLSSVETESDIKLEETEIGIKSEETKTDLRLEEIENDIRSEETENRLVPDNLQAGSREKRLERISAKYADLTSRCKDKKEMIFLLMEEIETDTLLLQALEKENDTWHVIKKQDLIEEIHIYLQENFAQRQSLDELAALFHISKSYMVHTFKEKYSFTVNEYLRQCRLKEARRLLEETNDTLASIAEKCGFHSNAYFTEIFQKEQGCTPTEYRKASAKHFSMTGNAAQPYQYKERKILKAELKINHREKD